ncbi:hypothetical protein, partial [Microcoleus sp. Pol12B4]|uniref:hypothetical protein n=1 Tax=Microcoleus sp. Pol12B4 TaxID=3055395 RepID=UPI002FD2B7A4
SRDTITLDNLLLNIDAFLNNFRDGIAGSYCSTVQSHLYIVPIFCNLHISLLHKFKSVLWLKNKTHKPATKIAADNNIFFRERFAPHGLDIPNSTLIYLN